MTLRLVLPLQYLLVGVTLGASLGGCVGDRLGGPTGETGFDFDNASPCRRVYDGRIRIQEATVTCVTDQQVRFFVDVRGWTSGAIVFSQETGTAGTQWADEHDLDTFRFGACQDFDHLERELATGLNENAWVPNLSTAFSCEQEDDDSWVHHGDPDVDGVMSYVVRAYAPDGSLADCLAFGHDPEGLLAGTYTRATEPTRPEELEGCRIAGSTTESSDTSTSSTSE